LVLNSLLTFVLRIYLALPNSISVSSFCFVTLQFQHQVRIKSSLRMQIIYCCLVYRQTVLACVVYVYDSLMLQTLVQNIFEKNVPKWYDSKSWINLHKIFYPITPSNMNKLKGILSGEIYVKMTRAPTNALSTSNVSTDSS
jgi:hypothetical protein